MADLQQLEDQIVGLTLLDAAALVKTLFELLYQGRCVQQAQSDNLIFQLLYVCHLCLHSPNSIGL